MKDSSYNERSLGAKSIFTNLGFNGEHGHTNSKSIAMLIVMIIYCYNKLESPLHFDVSKSMLIGVEGGVGGVQGQSIYFSSLLDSSVGGRCGASGGDALST